MAVVGLGVFWGAPSLFSLTGGVRFVQLVGRHGIKINHIPMRMQDVYAGSGGIPLANRSWPPPPPPHNPPQRQAYRITELKRWRSRLGIPVNIEPKFFPCNVDLASCMVIAGQRRGLPIIDFVNAVMRAIWAEDQNVADPFHLTHNFPPPLSPTVPHQPPPSLLTLRTFSFFRVCSGHSRSCFEQKVGPARSSERIVTP